MHASAFQQAGYTILPALLDAEALQAVDSVLRDADIGARGSRQMLAFDWCQALAETLRQQPVATGLIVPDYVPVQCICFEKSRDHHWMVAPHQDLSISVAHRVDHPALTDWSAKDAVPIVQKPRYLNIWTGIDSGSSAQARYFLPQHVVAATPCAVSLQQTGLFSVTMTFKVHSRCYYFI